ncbi:MAG: PQQ-binding-like beta-propeller repeat protein [Acidobacteria bacterium]|nr:PQQ-binding-like beta-propeller repeat protein [Acidobacteriota bacterium]
MLWLACVLSGFLSMAADWPRFRGPNGSGVSDAKNLPVEFGPKINLVWKLKAPAGTSSPIVVNGRVYLTGFEKDNRLVLAIDAKNGSVLWQESFSKTRTEASHPLNGPSTPTPASDGENVYVFFPEIGLISLDASGKERWRAPLGPFQSVQGLAASPVLVDDLVVLSIDQTRDSHVTAFDARTGKPRWKADRLSSLLGGYSTPVVYRPKQGPAQVILAGSLEITGYQVSTGERLWWASGYTIGPASTPVLHGDLLFTNEPHGAEAAGPFSLISPMDKNKDGKIERSEITDPGMARLLLGMDRDYGNGDGFLEANEWDKAMASGKDMGGLIALQLTGRADLTKAGLRWRTLKSVPYLTSGLIADGALFSVRDGGILTAFQPETGEILKQGRLEGALDKYYASPVGGDGKIYFTSENGKIAVVKAQKQWELLAVNDLEEPTYATPALTDGRVFVRTRQTLYCFGTLN